MFFDYNYDPFRFGGRYPSYANLRRQELARRERLAEEERRRRAELERRRRVEAELAHRREMQDRWRKEEMAELSARERLAQKRASLRRAPSYQIVRGPDGLLYSLPLEMEDEATQSKYNYEKRKDNAAPNQIVRGQDGRLYRVSCDVRDAVQMKSGNSHPNERENHNANVGAAEGRLIDEKEDNISSECVPLENDDASTISRGGGEGEVIADNWIEDEKRDGATPAENDLSPPSSPPVAVEDVPDEEDEELREMRSIWRNRAPSPGEWMEPIENFIG